MAKQARAAVTLKKEKKAKKVPTPKPAKETKKAKAGEKVKAKQKAPPSRAPKKVPLRAASKVEPARGKGKIPAQTYKSPEIFIKQLIQEAAPHYEWGNYARKKWQIAAPSSRAIAMLTGPERLALFRETLRLLAVLQAAPPTPYEALLGNVAALRKALKKDRLDKTSKFLLLKIQHQLLEETLPFEDEDLLLLFRELDYPRFNRYWHPLDGAVNALATACTIRQPAPELCQHVEHVAARVLERYDTKVERTLAAQLRQLVVQPASDALPAAASAAVAFSAPPTKLSPAAMQAQKHLERFLNQTSAQANKLSHSFGKKKDLPAYDEALALPPEVQLELIKDACQRYQFMAASMEQYAEINAGGSIGERSVSALYTGAIGVLLRGLVKKGLPLEEEHLLLLLQLTHQDEFGLNWLPVCEFLTLIERHALLQPLSQELQSSLKKLSKRLDVYRNYKLHRQQKARVVKLLDDARESMVYESPPISVSPRELLERYLQQDYAQRMQLQNSSGDRTELPAFDEALELPRAAQRELLLECCQHLLNYITSLNDIPDKESPEYRELDSQAHYEARGIVTLQEALVQKNLPLGDADFVQLIDSTNQHFFSYTNLPIDEFLEPLEHFAVLQPLSSALQQSLKKLAENLDAYEYYRLHRQQKARVVKLLEDAKSSTANEPIAFAAETIAIAAERVPQKNTALQQLLDRYLEQTNAQAAAAQNSLGDPTKLPAFAESLALPPAAQLELLREICQRLTALVQTLQQLDADNSPEYFRRRNEAQRSASASFQLLGTLAAQQLPLAEDDFVNLFAFTQQAEFGYTQIRFSDFLTALERYAALNPLSPRLRQSLERSAARFKELAGHKVYGQQLARVEKLLKKAIPVMEPTTSPATVPAADPQVASKARELLAQFGQQIWGKNEPRYSFGGGTLAAEPAGKAILALPPAEQTIVIAEALAFARKYDALPMLESSNPTVDFYRKDVQGMTYAAWIVQTAICSMLRRPLPLTEAGLIELLSWAAESPNFRTHLLQIDKLHTALNHFVVEHGATPALKAAVQAFLRRFYSVWTSRDDRKTAQHLEALVSMLKGPNIQPGEAWSDAALADLAQMKDKQASAWNSLLLYCQDGGEKKFTPKFRKEAEPLLKAVGRDRFRETITRWFPLVDKPRTQPQTRRSEYEPDYDQLLLDPHVDLLRGLVWCCGFEEDADLARAVMRLALSCYRKIPGKGPRLVSLGNACVTALGMMPGKTPIGQLAVLKVKIKFGTAQKEIEKAFNAAALRENLPRDEVEELAVPTYGLTEIGRAEEVLGDYTATLSIDGSDIALEWSKAGKPLKSLPAAVKTEHGEEVKELQTALKDLRTMLPAQRERLDGLFLLQKSWPLAVWRERYLDHPLVGTLARRLIWTFTTAGKTTDGAWHDGALRGVDGKELNLAESTTVAIWHPIGHSIDEIVAWRDWLEARRIVQPFKQAHREVYLLTDAERRTQVYSNRFAAHIIRQHQFNALALGRGWKNKLRLMVDDTYPPAIRLLPLWNLRAEFWIEGIGDDYGVDTNEAGAYLRLATDQVRFYELEAQVAQAHAGGGGYDLSRVTAEPLPLEQIPPLVLSEILRDVDLFVGVASVGNDPNWNDGGPDGRHVEYWNRYSFGELSQTASTRRVILEKLLPRLKIAAKCRLEERFLRVEGTKRNYRIHLGSGNILMEPNDQYLCIVPKQSTETRENLFLPFEGDNMLSIILSKALLLAADDKIKDTTIISQIDR